MEEMVRIAAAGAITAVLACLLRRHTPELALLLVLAAGVWMTVRVSDSLGAAAALMRELTELTGLEESLLEPVWKTVAVSILTRLTAEICRASGEGGAASFVELAGTVIALSLALPLARAVAQLMTELLR